MQNKRRKVTAFILLMLLPLTLGIGFLSGYFKGVEEGIDLDSYTPRMFNGDAEREYDSSATTRRILSFYSNNYDPYDQDFDRDSNNDGTKMFPFGTGKDGEPNWVVAPDIRPRVSWETVPTIEDVSKELSESDDPWGDWTPWILSGLGGGSSFVPPNGGTNGNDGTPGNGNGNGNGPPICVPRNEKANNPNIPHPICPDDDEDDKIVPVSEPGILGLIVLGLLGMILFRRKGLTVPE